MDYEVVETENCNNWRNNFKDQQAKRRIQARIDRASCGNFGDWKTESGDAKEV